MKRTKNRREEVICVHSQEGSLDIGLFANLTCILFLSPRLVSDRPRNAHAESFLVFFRYRLSEARCPKVRHGVESCNWPEIDGNERSTHPRSMSFLAFARRKQPRVRPTVDQVCQRPLLHELPGVGR